MRLFDILLTAGHLLQYLNGLARAITEKGAKIYEQTRVMSHDAHDVTTLEGHHVKARDAVVVATNSPIDHNLAIHARQSADRSYVVGLKIPKGSVE
jgi:glycine/D-amino acid oxidase-like deaminating enzyme